MINVKWIEYDCELINPISEEEALKHIEYCGRVCYNSYDKVGEDTALPFVIGLIKKNHLSVLEHCSVTCKVTLDRGLSHEWVRHRVGSAYSQTSTRYCKYNDTIECIMPVNMRDNDVSKPLFKNAVERSCETYSNLLENKVAPQIARGVLPTCLATTLIATHNFREWRHIFSQRYFNINAHPDMRYLMGIVYNKLNGQYPSIFGDMINATGYTE